MPADQDASVNINSRVDQSFGAANAGYLGSFAGYEEIPSAEPITPFDYGQKASFSTPGTPYTGSRYQGPSSIPYSQPDPPPQNAPPDPWAARGWGRADSGFVRGATFEDTSAPWYSTSPPSAADPRIDSPAPIFNTFEAASARKREIELSQRDLWTADGRFNDIGGDEWKKELQASLVEEGLAKAPKTGLAKIAGDLAHDKMGLAFGVGYSAMAFGQGASAMARLDNGQYVSPEERQGAQVEAAAPAVGGIAGTVIGGVIGSLIPGIGTMAGSMAGQFIGGAAGEAVAANTGAGMDRAQGQRELTERLSASAGGTAEALDKLKTAVEAAHAPIQQLAQGVQTLMSIGPGVGVQAVQSADRFAVAAGANFQEDVKGVGKFLTSHSALYDLRSQFATQGPDSLSPTTYRSVGKLALYEGDMDAYNAAQDSAAKARYAEDPELARLQNEYADRGKQLWGLGGWLQKHEFGWGYDTKLQGKIDARKKQLDQSAQDTSAEDVALANTLNAARFSADQSGLQASVASSGYDLAELNGDSADQLAGRLPGIAAAQQGRISSDQTFIAQAQNALRTEKDPRVVRAYQQDILKYSADVQQAEAVAPQAVRANTLQGLGERQSAFALQNLIDTVHGVSVEDQYDGDMAFYHKRGLEARTLPGLTPEQRDQIEGAALQGAYQTQQGLFAERRDKLDTFLSGASAGVAQAAATGGPGEQFAAAGREIEALRARFAELTQELRTGGQTVADYNREQQQLNQTQGQIAAATAQQRTGYYSAVESMDASGQTVARAGLSRDVALQGNGAFGRLAAVDAASLATLRDDLAHEPAGTVRHKGLEALIAGMTAQQADDVTNAQIYRPGVRERSEDLSVRTAYQIALAAPYMDGPQSSPFTASAGLIAQDRKELARIGATDRQATDPLAHFANQQQEDSLRLEIARLEHDQLNEGAQWLPEVVAGSPGRGVVAGSMPTQALAALFNPTLRTGGWGGASASGETPTIEGGAAARFEATHRSTTMPNGSGEVAGLLRQILETLRSPGNSPARTPPTRNTQAITWGLGGSPLGAR